MQVVPRRHKPYFHITHIYSTTCLFLNNKCNFVWFFLSLLLLYRLCMLNVSEITSRFCAGAIFLMTDCKSVSHKYVGMFMAICVPKCMRLAIVVN